MSEQKTSPVIDRYSRLISNNPIKVIAVTLVLFIISGVASGNVQIVSQENSDFLPEGVQEVEAFDLLTGVYGDQESLLISVEIDPEYAGSDEPRDIREPEVVRYIDLVSENAASVDKVAGVTSPSTLLREANSGVLPLNRRDIIDIVEESQFFDTFITDDNEMAVIRLNIDNIDGSEDIRDLVKDLLSVIESTPQPAGLDVNVAGDLAVGPQIEDQLGPDIGRTSVISFVGIILVLLILFRSLRYGFMPLIVIVIGISWAFGTLGILGINLNDATSGVISMIMGIGIDFGIQVTMRFRQELKSLIPSEAMQVTLNNVLAPMTTTTVAALLGFWAMGTGNLSFMGEFGRIMSYGVLFTFLAAITIVPAVLIMGDKICLRFNKACRGPVDQLKSILRRSKKRRGLIPC